MKMSKWKKLKGIASVATGSLSVYKVAPAIMEAGERMYEFEKANPNLTPWYSTNGGTPTVLTMIWLMITVGTYVGIIALEKYLMKKYFDDNITRSNSMVE